MMRRREFISLLGFSAAAWPLVARAQRAALPVVGFLRDTPAEASVNLVAALRQGLQESGYVEGRNVAIEYRWSETRLDPHSALAADLVRRQCAVIIAGGNAPLVAARSATQTIPIIFVSGEDPVALGFVPSLNRPVGNITGVTFYSGTLAAKQLELLRSMAPRTSVMGMLVNPTSPATAAQIENAQAAARALGLQIHVVDASGESDFDAAFAAFAQLRVDALLVAGNSMFTGQRDRLALLAARHALPAVYDLHEFVAAGGLMSYGSSSADAYRQAGIYAGRILNGAKPAELPVTFPTKFELVINLRTAKALGLAIPPNLLAIADEVIE